MQAPATPDHWHWAITPADIEEIKAGNRTTVNRVYFDNYEKFKHIAYKFCYRYFSPQLIEDFLQQIYLDLPKYDFSNVKTFYCGLQRSFLNLRFGRSVQVYSIELKADDDGKTLLDFLKAPEVQSESERKAENAAALRLIDLQRQLTEAQKDYLTAVAFGCAVFKGLFDYAKREIFTNPA